MLKAPVKLRGVQVGKVDTIRFDPAQPRQILVDIEVDSDAPIAPGTQAKLGYQGITRAVVHRSARRAGSDGSKQSVLQTRRIALAPGFLDQLQDAGPKLAAGALATMDRIQKVLSDSNQQQLSQTLAQLNESPSAGSMSWSRNCGQRRRRCRGW